MNVARHTAWALNPNLSADDFQRLVEEDCAREEERVKAYLARVGETIADTSLDKESRRKLALQQLSYLPWMLSL